MTIVGAVVLLALVITVVCALVRPSPGWVTAALACAAGWPFVNDHWEGPVLWVPAPGHGLTLSDLLTPVAAALVTSRLYLLRRGSGAQA